MSSNFEGETTILSSKKDKTTYWSKYSTPPRSANQNVKSLSPKISQSITKIKLITIAYRLVFVKIKSCSKLPEKARLNEIIIINFLTFPPPNLFGNNERNLP